MAKARPGEVPSQALQPKVTIHEQPIASTIKGAVAGAAAHVNAVHASAQVKGKGSEGK